MSFLDPSHPSFIVSGLMNLIKACNVRYASGSTLTHGFTMVSAVVKMVSATV